MKLNHHCCFRKKLQQRVHAVLPGNPWPVCARSAPHPTRAPTVRVYKECTPHYQEIHSPCVQRVHAILPGNPQYECAKSARHTTRESTECARSACHTTREFIDHVLKECIPYYQGIHSPSVQGVHAVLPGNPQSECVRCAHSTTREFTVQVCQGHCNQQDRYRKITPLL